MVSARTEYARHLVALGALALGVLALLLVPALASAQTAAPAASPSLLEASPFDAEAAPADPAATDPADPTATDPAPPATTEPDPAAEPPPATEPEPAPPPAATEPEPTPVPAPAPTEPQPTTPVATTPTPAETPAAEATPETHQTVVLPPAPSLPSSMRPAVVPARLVAPAPAVPPDAPVITPVAPPTAPPDAPTGAATSEAASDALATTAREATPRSSLEALGGVSRAPDALTATASRDIGPGPAGQSAAHEDGENPFDTLTATGGPASAGSSLLSVLASYVMPGGGLPVATIILFIQLAVILAAFYAPRAGIAERIHALGRLGPMHGYRTVLARPG